MGRLIIWEVNNMATVGQRILESFNGAAGVDLTGKQFYAVRLAGDNQIDAITAAGQTPIGVLEIPPYAPGGAATVCVLGATKAVAGGAFSAGAYLAVDDQGRVIAAAAGAERFAIALQAAAAAGEVVEILVLHAGKA